MVDRFEITVRKYEYLENLGLKVDQKSLFASNKPNQTHGQIFLNFKLVMFRLVFMKLITFQTS